MSVIVLTGSPEKPDADTAAFQRKAPLLLWAMDNDKAGAGQWPWWQENLPVSLWPVPGGKDPGDCLQAGGAIRRWLERGLQYAGTGLAEVLKGTSPGHLRGWHTDSGRVDQAQACQWRRQGFPFAEPGSSGKRT